MSMYTCGTVLLAMTSAVAWHETASVARPPGRCMGTHKGLNRVVARPHTEMTVCQGNVQAHSPREVQLCQALQLLQLIQQASSYVPVIELHAQR